MKIMQKRFLVKILIKMFKSRQKTLSSKTTTVMKIEKLNLIKSGFAQIAIDVMIRMMVNVNFGVIVIAMFMLMKGKRKKFPRR